MDREITVHDFVLLEMELGYRVASWLGLETEEAITACHRIFRAGCPTTRRRPTCAETPK
jgi:hypothetical protein